MITSNQMKESFVRKKESEKILVTRNLEIMTIEITEKKIVQHK